MNPYLPLSTRLVHQNNIPPRLMWNINNNVWTASSSGYCGETALQSAGLLYGQYVPQYFIRELLINYYAGLGAGFDKAYGNVYGSTTVADPTDPANTVQLSASNIKQHGQYCCQMLLGVPDAADETGMMHVLDGLRFNIDAQHDIYAAGGNTQQQFIPWLKQRVLQGLPVITGLQDQSGNDPEYDHIIIVTGWGSNQPLDDFAYYTDDEILFSDHGLLTTGGSMPYYFHFVMESGANGTRPDGGCPGTTVWNFIMDLEGQRKIQGQACNAYQLAQVPSAIHGNTPLNYGLAITGVCGGDLLPVRIDTDFNYEYPCITTGQAWNAPNDPPQPPKTAQTMTHTVTVSGMTAGTSYNIWLYRDLVQVPTDNFNASDKQFLWAQYTPTDDTPYVFQLQEKADVPVIFRCVPQSAK